MSSLESKDTDNVEADKLDLEDINLESIELNEVFPIPLSDIDTSETVSGETDSTSSIPEVDGEIDPISPVLSTPDENIALNSSELENIMSGDETGNELESNNTLSFTELNEPSGEVVSDTNIFQNTEEKASNTFSDPPDEIPQDETEVTLSNSELQNVLHDTKQLSSKEDTTSDSDSLDLSHNQDERVILDEEEQSLDFFELELLTENQKGSQEDTPKDIKDDFVDDPQHPVYEEQEEGFISLENEYEDGQKFTKRDDSAESSLFPQSTETHTPVVENPPDFSHLGVEGSLHSDRMAEKISQEEGLNIRELRRMILYLDQLFGKLPEGTVHEFSRSKYFDLYKKVIYDLGL